MSDHIFDYLILRELQQISLVENYCILCVDRKTDGNHYNLSDATKVLIEDDKVKRIGKNIEHFNAIDTGIFLCSFIIFDALRVSISRQEYSLSAGNQVLANWGKLKTFDIGTHFWIDVDDKETLQIARKELFKRLKRQTYGTV